MSEAVLEAGEKPAVTEPPPPAGRATEGAPVVTAEPAASRTSREDFAKVIRAVQDAAREWNIREDLPEGKFVSAFLGAVDWMGRVSLAGQAELRQIAQQQSDVAKVDLARAEALAKATNASLSQARSAMINLQVERENLAASLAKDTMPMFADKLRDALVLRVTDETSALRLKRAVLAGVCGVVIFLGGFALCAWNDREAISALSRCLAQSLPGQGARQGHLYCDVTSFGEPSH